MRKLLSCTAMAICLLAAPALAAMQKPAVINSTIEADAPYGEGSLSKLFIKAYDAALWTDAQSWSWNDPFAFVIKYDMKFSRDELVDRSLEEMKDIGELPKEKEAAYKQQLTNVFPAEVKKGDTVTALFDPKKGTSFFHNAKPVGNIRDLKLSERFLSIWLSPKTSEPRLRKALLGNHDS